MLHTQTPQNKKIAWKLFTNQFIFTAVELICISLYLSKKKKLIIKKTYCNIFLRIKQSSYLKHPKFPSFMHSQMQDEDESQDKESPTNDQEKEEEEESKEEEKEAGELPEDANSN